METEERRSMVALCGIDCGNCAVYLSKDNKQVFDALIKRGFSAEKMPCPGCRAAEGNCPVIGERCETYICATGRGLTYCHECRDFPCIKLNPSADRAEVLPHNTKVYNLCVIKNRGVDRFIEESKTIEERYFKGKMEIGKGPIK
jgi:hypothetical protein